MIHTLLNLAPREKADGFMEIYCKKPIYKRLPPSTLRTGFASISTHLFWWVSLLLCQLRSHCRIPADDGSSWASFAGSSFWSLHARVPEGTVTHLFSIPTLLQQHLKVISWSHVVLNTSDNFHISFWSLHLSVTSKLPEWTSPFRCWKKTINSTCLNRFRICLNSSPLPPNSSHGPPSW